MCACVYIIVLYRPCYVTVSCAVPSCPIAVAAVLPTVLPPAVPADSAPCPGLNWTGT